MHDPCVEVGFTQTNGASTNGALPAGTASVLALGDGSQVAKHALDGPLAGGAASAAQWNILFGANSDNEPQSQWLGCAPGSCDWSIMVNHNTIVYKYRPCAQCCCVAPAHH